MVAFRISPVVLFVVVLTTLVAGVHADSCPDLPAPTIEQMRAGAEIPRDTHKQARKYLSTFTNGSASLNKYPGISVTVTIDDGGSRKYVVTIAAIGGQIVPPANYQVVLSHGHGDGAKVIKTFGINGFQQCWWTTIHQENPDFRSIDHVTVIKV